MRMPFSRAWLAKQEERQSRVEGDGKLCQRTQQNGNKRIINVNRYNLPQRFSAVSVLLLSLIRQNVKYHMSLLLYLLDKY